MLLLFVALLACTGDAGDTGAVDTGEKDSGEPPVNARFVLDGDWEGGTVALLRVDPAALEVRAIGTQGTFAYAPATEGLEIRLPKPGDAALTAVDEAAHPDVRVTWLVPALYPDADGDGEISADDDFWGVAATWLLYVSGSPEGVSGLEGAVEGWNAREMDLSRLSPSAPADLAAVPLSASLRLQPVELRGQWENAPGNAGVALISRVALQGGTVADPVLAQVTHASEFELRLADAPPDDHFAPLSTGDEGAVEMGLSFVDTNNNDTFNLSDSPLYHLCAGATPIGLLYLPRVPRLDLAVDLAAVNGGAGWNAYDFGAGLLDRGVLEDLVAGPPCPTARAPAEE